MSNKSVFKKEKLSLWLKDGINESFPNLKSDISCDICIVGAGLAGITTTYILSLLNFDVVLIDSGTPMNLTSGNTTAKFTFQHDLIYSNIIENYGLEEAKLYYEAQVKGMEFVRNLVDKYNIDCDFKNTYSMIYAENEEQFEEIEKEYEAYNQLNIPCELVGNMPYGIAGIGGLKVYNQFCLNPVKYTNFLLKKLKENNVRIFQNTNAVDLDIDDDFKTIVTEDDLEIAAKKIVVATGYPFLDKIGLYYTRLEAYRSYLVAFPISDELEDDAMLISNSISPYSIRFSDTDGQKYLLVGGRGHKVGQESSAKESYNELINFGQEHFNVQDIEYRWSSQDYQSLDKIPYIGKTTSKYNDIFVATGFKKWGMTNSTFSAILLSALISEKSSKFEDLFSPSRKEVLDNLGGFMKANLNVAKELIKGKVLPDEVKLKDIGIDQGGIIKYDGYKAGAYRDQSGKLFLVDSKCTHLGCELEYNNAERSFDCPCHGSRFTYKGKVIEGPAVLDLEQIQE